MDTPAPPSTGSPAGPSPHLADKSTTAVFAPQLPIPGLEPGIEPHELSTRSTQAGSAKATCIDYSAEQIHVEQVADLRDFLSRHRASWTKVRWIRIQGLTDMEAIRAIAEKYGLHPLAIEDLLTPQRPKAEDYPSIGDQPGRLFVVARSVRRHAGRLQTDQVCMFLGRSTVISFERPGVDYFGALVKRIEKPNSRVRLNDSSFLLYSMLDVLIDHLFPMLEEFAGRIETLEKSLLENPTAAAFKKIRHLKHDLIELRRVVWPMRELILDLRRDAHECLSPTTQTYIRDVYDHNLVLFELIENYRDLLSDLMETYMSAVSQRTNEIMKVLTIISTIFVPLTFLAGVYGMNMPIPENKWAGSYPIFWAITLLTIVGMLAWFRSKKWI